MSQTRIRTVSFVLAAASITAAVRLWNSASQHKMERTPAMGRADSETAFLKAHLDSGGRPVQRTSELTPTEFWAAYQGSLTALHDATEADLKQYWSILGTQILSAMLCLVGSVLLIQAVHRTKAAEADALVPVPTTLSPALGSEHATTMFLCLAR